MKTGSPPPDIHREMLYYTHMICISYDMYIIRSCLDSIVCVSLRSTPTYFKGPVRGPRDFAFGIGSVNLGSFPMACDADETAKELAALQASGDYKKLVKRWKDAGGEEEHGELCRVCRGHFGHVPPARRFIQQKLGD